MKNRNLKSKKGCLIIAAVLLLLCGLVVISLLGVQMLQQRQERARMKYQPPVVQITNPINGTGIPVGSFLSADSVIAFMPENPVQTVEWYLDGVLAESHLLKPRDGISRMYDSYSVLVPTEGPHMLVARAINSHGLVGKSLPLTFQGVPKGEAFYEVAVTGNDTLESLAASYESEAATLQSLNPEVANSLPAGSTIKVPVPPDGEKPSLPITPSVDSKKIPDPTTPMLKIDPIPADILSLLATSPPQAPTNLQGEVKDCKVKLVWEDNSDNESGYEVWMAAPGAPLVKLALLQPASGGVTWFEFKSPGTGYYLFWVEAVNAVGQQGSNIINLNVDSGCPVEEATYLQVEILDITVNGSADRVYCYVSFENALEVRLPANDGAFIAIQGGKGNVTDWPHTFGVPIPADDKLEITGECWGWSGSSLNKLGDFNGGAAKKTWDGKKYVINAGNAKIGIAVSPLGQTGKKWTFSERLPGIPGSSPPNATLYDLPADPNLTPPKNLTKADIVDPTPPHLRHVILYWDYEGGTADAGVDGFTIYLNGAIFKSINSAYLGYGTARYEREATMLLPADMVCGKHMRWEVAANAGPAQSRLSDPLEYDLPPCDMYAMVEFRELYVKCTADNNLYDCNLTPMINDKLDTYYNLSVNSTTQSHWGGNFFIPVQVGQIKFADIGAYYLKPFPDTIVVPILSDPFQLDIRTKFWDHDEGFSDDEFGSHRIDLYYDIEETKNDLKLGELIGVTNVNKTGTAISLNLEVRVTIFPNDNSKSPPFGEYKSFNPSGIVQADLHIYPSSSHEFEVRIANKGPSWVDLDTQITCSGVAKWTDTNGAGISKVFDPVTRKIHLTLKNGEITTYKPGFIIDSSYSSLIEECSIPVMDIDPNPENNTYSIKYEE